MDSTKLLLISLFLILYMIWDQWQIDYVRRPALQSAQTQAQSGLAGGESSADPAAEERRKAQLVHIRTDVFDIDISRMGGVIESLRLLKYPTAVDKPQDPFVLLTDTSEKVHIAQSGFRGSNPAPDHKTEYQVEQSAFELPADAKELNVKLSWTSPDGVVFDKIFTFHRGSYVVDLNYALHNGGSAPWTGRFYSQLLRSYEDDNKSMVRTFTGAAISSDEKRYEKIKFDEMRSKALARDITDGWAAMVQHYFVAAMIPPARDTFHYYTLTAPKNEFAIGLYGPELHLDQGADTKTNLRYYLGPKDQNVLAGVAPGLELTADYGSLWFLAKPIFYLLNFFNGITGNWGLAIILVTVTLKSAFFQLSAAQYKSMAKMRRMQPRLTALRERYADDKQRLNQAMMELYREERINPLGGCLPILIQIPVFISLYWVLLETVELRQAPFFLWIKDLSIPDPYYVLPLLMGISMYIQQKLSPSTMDPMQQKVLQALPVIFSVTFALFASGLVLYWVVNNVLSIAQQWIITKKYGDPNKPLPETDSTG